MPTTSAVSTLVRIALYVLPKYLMSRLARLLASIPLPSPLRPTAYRGYAFFTGADVSEARGDLRDYRNLRAFFQRPLREGARPVADAEVVWPCDGRIIACGPMDGDRIPQVKGVDYTLMELLQDETLAGSLTGGTQVTIYLAPADYHRVHSPCTGRLTAVQPIPGRLFPVNGPAVRSIPRLLPRNARQVFHYRLADDRPAALVMVAALMVTDTTVTCPVPGIVSAGEEIGRFGFGSTVVLVMPPGGPRLERLPAGTAVRMGASAPLQRLE